MNESLPDVGGADWSDFRGIPNTKEVLGEKAAVIAALIEMDCDGGITFASTCKEKPGYAEVRVGEEQVRRVRVEAALVLLRLVDEIAFGVLGSEERGALMGDLEVRVADMLDRKGGVSAAEFAKLRCERFAEYAHYRKWVNDENEGQKNALLWEYAKKIGAIVNIEQDALFNAILTNLLLRSFERWNLQELLAC
jgi:hypothetical protein